MDTGKSIDITAFLILSDEFPVSYRSPNFLTTF